jgi:hypothetical protein
MGGPGSGRRAATYTPISAPRATPPILPEPKLYRWTCGQCGVPQAMTEETNVTLRRSSATFYCVHGHQRHYPQGKSETQKLQEQLDEERRKRQRSEQDAAYQRDRAREAEEQAKHERARANGYKGHATRITKRAKAGLCPCCNRSFINMARHMATKHPQFTPIELEVIEGGKAANG